MASYTPPTLHAVNDVFAVTDWNAVANDIVFLYQRPYISAYNSVATALINIAFTQVSLGTTEFSGYGFSISSNNLIVPLTGIYSVSAALSANIESERLVVNVFQNGSQKKQSTTQFDSAGGAIGVTAAVTGLLSCNAGDTIGLYGLQASGLAVNTNTGPTTTWISALFMGSQ